MEDPVTEYANNIISGQILSCRYIKQACQRHLDDLKRNDIYFDKKKALKPIDFCNFLYHYKGSFAGEIFKPEPWQKFIIGSIFGWHKKNGKRRYKYGYIEVPRKNGKTFLAAGVFGLYLLCADGEASPEIYSVATKEDQAKISWRDAVSMIKKNPDLASIMYCKVKTIENFQNDGFFVPLGSDSDRLDGLNPHGVIVDEFHAWPDRGLWDVMEDAFGSRDQPLMIAITTAGYNRNICYEQREYAINILQGKNGFKDDTYFSVIYTVDDPNDWQNPKEWQKANPNLGVSKYNDFMVDLCEKAKNMPSKLNAFKNKQLNIWTETGEKWLNMDKWDKCINKINLDDLEGYKCYVGLDLASTEDLNATAYLFPPQKDLKNYFIFTKVFLPSETLNIDTSRRQRLLLNILRDWRDKNIITDTPGSMTDYNYIVKDLKKNAEKFKILEIAFDPYNARQISVELDKEGFNMIQFNQTIMNFSEPTKKLSALINSKKINHNGDPVLRWMMSNAVVYSDANDNERPDKKKSSEKIDGVVATIMALGRALYGEKKEKPIPRIRSINR